MIEFPRIFYSGEPRRMTLREMGDLMFDLTARCVGQNGNFEHESWVWFRLQDAEGIEAVGRFIDRLTPYSSEIAELLTREAGGRRR